MRLLRKIRISPPTVIACIALAIALGGTGYAAFKLPANSVTTREVKNRSLLAVDFKLGQLPRGAQGPAGPAGSAGPAGPAGPAGTGGAASVKWALVKPDGTIAAQSGGISLSSHSTGQYIFDLGGAIATKLVSASPGLANDNSTRGVAIAGPCGGTAEGFACPSNNDTNHVIVRTYGATNTVLEDHSFYVSVTG
jgi:hypothetical protein